MINKYKNEYGNIPEGIVCEQIKILDRDRKILNLIKKLKIEYADVISWSGISKKWMSYGPRKVAIAINRQDFSDEIEMLSNRCKIEKLEKSSPMTEEIKREILVLERTIKIQKI